MTKKSIDVCVLGAFHVLSKDSTNGVTMGDCVSAGVNVGVLTLLDKGYVDRVKEEEDNIHQFVYKLTNKGEEYLAKILKYASKID